VLMWDGLSPHERTITVNGFDVVKHPNEVRRLIGIAFQDPRVDGNTERVRVLNWHLKMTTTLDKDERRRRVEEALKALDLWDHARADLADEWRDEKRKWRTQRFWFNGLA